MICNFRVGQKVVCIDDSELNLNGENGPALNRIYTVRGVTIYGILLEEVLNEKRGYCDGYDEPHWRHERFRPVMQRKTDISIFKAMLKTSKALSPQDAR